MSELIRKQDAIKAICEDGTWLERQGCTEITMVERKQRDVDIIENLPPVQPETATITIGRTRGETTMWYECDACGEPVDLKDNYCRNCGRKLIHD